MNGEGSRGDSKDVASVLSDGKGCRTIQIFVKVDGSKVFPHRAGDDRGPLHGQSGRKHSAAAQKPTGTCKTPHHRHHFEHFGVQDSAVSDEVEAQIENVN